VKSYLRRSNKMGRLGLPKSMSAGQKDAGEDMVLKLLSGRTSGEATARWNSNVDCNKYQLVLYRSPF